LSPGHCHDRGSFDEGHRPMSLRGGFRIARTGEVFNSDDICLEVRGRCQRPISKDLAAARGPGRPSCRPNRRALGPSSPCSFGCGAGNDFYAGAVAGKGKDWGSHKDHEGTKGPELRLAPQAASAAVVVPIGLWGERFALVSGCDP
jgi:hypothetical protein